MLLHEFNWKKEVLQATEPVLVDFWASWCPPCRAMNPTIEGLATDGALHALQQAFIDHDAFQCGYCTPGQICSAAGLIAEGRAKSADEIRELMSGNICRCGAYPNIVAAIEEVMLGNAAKTSGETGR